MLVIVRDDGLYVARRGEPHSYTRKLERARVYTSAREAAGDLCPDNERIEDIANLLSIAS